MRAENVGATNVEIRSSRQRAIQLDSKRLDKLPDAPDVKFEVLGDIFDTMALAKFSQLERAYSQAGCNALLTQPWWACAAVAAKSSR